MITISNIVKTLLILSLCTSCNGLFYHPDQIIYSQPKNFGLDFSKYNLKECGSNEISVLELKTNIRPSRGILIQAHGNAQNLSAHIFYTKFFIDLGFDIFAFDYQGYGETKGSPSRENTIADTTCILERLARTRKEPLALFGQSLGGAVLVTSLGKFTKEEQSRFHMLILDSTFSSYPGVAKEKVKSIWLLWPFQIFIPLLISKDLNPIDSAPNIYIPILQTHSSKDPVVPFSEGKILFESFTNSKPKLWLETHEPRHTNAFVNPNETFLEKVDQFMKEASLFSR